MQRAFDPQQIPHKLEIKQENKIFAQWLRDQLGKHFNYVCCDSEEQFQHESRAITQNGLIKHGGEKHEKNDRFAIGDRGQYILGWSNISKINALEVELQQINQKIAQINKQVQLLETQRKQKQDQVSLLQDFMRFIDFAEVDWRSVEVEKLNLQKQKQELEASSNKLKQIETDLQSTKKRITQEEQQRDQLIREIQTLENQQDAYKKEQIQCEKTSQSVLSSEIEAFENEKHMAKRLREY